MIKILRNFRQALLTQNKFSKYLMYAVGEISQIRNWQSIPGIRS